MKRIEAVLRREIGLDAASIGSSVIERTVRLRMKSQGVSQVEEYLHLIATQPTELEELIEAVVVAETWFFRDPESFTSFIWLVKAEWLPQNPAGVLRVLSVPCSSGEEPYSLAMALLDAGLEPAQFVIEAQDLSARALARAQRAVYGKNSFRGKDLAGLAKTREKYFQTGKEGWALQPRVRACVHFRRANLLSTDAESGRETFDFIFCRNLLIYFDVEMQLRTIERLHRMLAAAGILFVGTAEQPLVIDRGFVNANLPMSFACRKTTSRLTHSSRRPRRSPAPAGAPPARPAVSGAKYQVSGPDPSHPAPDPSHLTPRTTDLDAARALADAGQFEEANAVCETHLRQEGPSAKAYYLLGLICDARGDDRAAEYYRKALYLEPDHYESLLQLSLLLERGGDAAAARVFKRRAQRVQQKG